MIPRCINAIEYVICTEQQKKRCMNTRYQHGRLHTGCFENHSSRIPSPGFSGTVMIQNDVRLHISRKRYM